MSLNSLRQLSLKSHLSGTLEVSSLIILTFFPTIYSDQQLEGASQEMHIDCPIKLLDTD